MPSPRARKRKSATPDLTGNTQPRRAWWLVTRRRRAEWQTLRATGQATFMGTPRRHMEAARPGDPVLFYVSRPDHAILAVGTVAEESAGKERGTSDPQLDVQLAFELPTPLPWRDITEEPELAGAEPVRGRSSGTLFALTHDEYSALQVLIIERNPELAAAFAGVDAEPSPRTAQEAIEQEPGVVREPAVPYVPQSRSVALPAVNSINDLHALTGLPCE